MSIVLGRGEGIILIAGDAYWASRSHKSLDELVLTNKRIYCSYTREISFFKTTTENYEFNLGDIIVSNGQASVSQTKYEGEQCLQIRFTQGNEYFSFANSPKKIIPQWVDAINNVLGTVSCTDTKQSSENYSYISNVLSGFADAFLDVFNMSTSVNDTRENYMRNKNSGANNDEIYETKVSNRASRLEEDRIISSGMKFCTECGSPISVNAKFCSACGSPVNMNNFDEMISENDNFSSKKVKDEEIQVERQQEYIGKVYKCPNCGNVVNISDVICSACGCHLSGKSAISSAKDFQEQLMKIESRRQNKTNNHNVQREALDATDKEVISFIKMYPIPNSIEDIVEFFYLAVANIDVNKSKKSMFNTDAWDGGDRERSLSNAWVGKMQSIYAKAELYFPDETEFAKIKEVYDSIMAQLKIK